MLILCVFNNKTINNHLHGSPPTPHSAIPSYTYTKQGSLSQSSRTLTLWDASIFKSGLDDLDGVVLQVEVDLALPDAVLLLSPLNHCLLVVCIKTQHLGHQWSTSLISNHDRQLSGGMHQNLTLNEHISNNGQQKSGSGGFLLTQGFWEKVDKSIPTCTFFFFCKVEISSCTPVTLFWPGSVHSGSASWDDCGWVFPDELHLSLFPW